MNRLEDHKGKKIRRAAGFLALLLSFIMAVSLFMPSLSLRAFAAEVTLQTELKTVDHKNYTVSVKLDPRETVPENLKIEAVEVNQVPADLYAPENAGRPFATERFVTEEEMKSMTAELRRSMGLKDTDETPFVKFLDIRFSVDGKEYAPQYPSEVTITTDALKASEIKKEQVTDPLTQTVKEIPSLEVGAYRNDAKRDQDAQIAAAQAQGIALAPEDLIRLYQIPDVTDHTHHMETAEAEAVSQEPVRISFKTDKYEGFGLANTIRHPEMEASESAAAAAAAEQLEAEEPEEPAKPVLTITAGSAEKAYDGEELKEDSYTSSGLEEGDTIESVTVTGSQTLLGTSENVPGDAKIVDSEGGDVTEKYEITYVSGTLSVTWDTDPVQKALTDFQGNLASYQITVNPDGDIINGGESLTLKDTFSNDQSIIYSTIEVTGAAEEEYSYDYSGQTGTFTLPDATPVTITYQTRVQGSVGENKEFQNTAVLGRTEKKEGASPQFIEGAFAAVSDTELITPTGTDIHGQEGVYSINLFVYPEGHMEKGLEGAVFRLLDSNMRPMVYKAGENAGLAITFSTDENGTVPILLNEETDGLSLRKNTVYYLEMITAPFAISDGDYVYYQKDNTYYSFLITDMPNYTYGSVYSYYNGDVLKVRCYPESKGVNVTKRFSGNYELTEEQKNAIRFILQKEDMTTESGWVDVESHTYAEFSYGSLNFNTGRDGESELQDNATYRVIEENALPEELEGSVRLNDSVSITYQRDGVPVEDTINEFFIDPDDEDAFSYNLSFTNEYIEHKLTLTKMDEMTGNVLPGAVFHVYEASGDSDPVASYTTDEKGQITIRKSFGEEEYAADTLYYAAEASAPEGYILPEEPEKVYFYFPENKSGVPAGLPEGMTATDLSNSYDAVTIADHSEQIDVPVTVVWGNDGKDDWPSMVGAVTIGLYKSVGGAEPVPVTDENDDPLQVQLTSSKQYDASLFMGLPALEEGERVVYSVVEEQVTGTDGTTDLTSSFASGYSVSGTGWYVVRNQTATSVKIQKVWLDQGGGVISDTSGKPEITYSLYRTTEEDTFTGDVSRSELLAFLEAEGECVRTGLSITNANNWTVEVPSLEEKDPEDQPYHYYALEDVPDNQEDFYVITEASGADPRTLTIKNKQTPVTVVIKAADIEKTYGENDPSYEFDPEASRVMEEGSSIQFEEPEDGVYTAVITAPDESTKSITFSMDREAGENAGTYTITPSGSNMQEGYRVLFETGTLTINKREVTVTAGGTKVYGDPEPSLVTVEGLAEGEDASVIEFEVSREEGEDAGIYPITLTGETEQQNFKVTFVRADEGGNPYVFTISRAPAIVTADDKNKSYGADDPEFTATVTGLKNDDAPSVIANDLTRVEGENVGAYTITPAGDQTQGNYTVTYEPGTLTIGRAAVTVKAEAAEKTYGDPDPEWEMDISGLQRGEDSGELTSVLNEATGERTYTYTTEKDGETETLLSFTVSRESGEGIGSYVITPSSENAEQGNYALTFEPGRLDISRAELVVSADRIVKAVGIPEDPLLTATITGWKNGDEGSVATSSVASSGVIIWTYTRTVGENTETLLTFTLHRDPGEVEGEYVIMAAGDEEQSNYQVSYESGIFGVLSVLDIDVSQPVIDYADYSANPEYSYTAKLNLAGTGLSEYNKNGFEKEGGVPTLHFTLPEDGASMKTLKVPGGAGLTVTQDPESENPDYTTAVSLDGNPYAASGASYVCEIGSIGTYHEIAFTHSRISLPVQARASEDQTEGSARVLQGRKGAVGIPDGERLIDGDFADAMHSNSGYEIPADKYYVYDHASLYTTAGVAIDGATGITSIGYDSGRGVWLYKIGEGGWTDVPADAQIVLFYLPKYVCRIGDVPFYSIKEAVAYAVSGGYAEATVEMLIPDYSIRYANETVTIPEGLTVTITTAGEGFEGEGTAVISRSMSFPNEYLFINQGTLVFDNVILDGKNVASTAAMIQNKTPVRSEEPAPAPAVLTLTGNSVLKNARGTNGGGIYVTDGNVSIAGSLEGNSATSGGAVYVNGGTVEVSGALTNNSASDRGGAVYVNGGTVMISSNEIINNSASYGGVVYMVKDTSVTISGTIGGTETDEGNTAQLGGAVYMTGGTLEVSGAIQNSSANSGGAVYMTAGSLSVSGRIGDSAGNPGNTAQLGGGIYLTGGSVSVTTGTIAGNTAQTSGGGIYQSGGSVEISGTGSVTANEAVSSGGAVYLTGGTFSQTGGTISDNTAANGGAIYGAGGTIAVSGGELKENIASAGNGGAIYSTTAPVTISGGSITSNTSAGSGGAIYTTNAAVTVTEGSLSENTAGGNGGAISTESGAVTVSGGIISSNTSTAGNGGAIYSTGGAVTVTEGSLSGNTAGGNGGALCLGSGNLTYSGGTITGSNADKGGAIYVGSGKATIATSISGNQAGNGAALFVDTGIADISEAITGNTAGNGGAVGVGSTFARLYFKGNAKVTGNTMNGLPSNVYLDVDSDQVINVTDGYLQAENPIGIYVPGDINSEQVVKHGDVGGNFGAYTNTTNVEAVFKNDRFPDLDAKYENSRLYWGAELTYDVVYKAAFGDDPAEPPLAGASYDTTDAYRPIAFDQSFYPHGTSGNLYNIYDLVTGLKLYERYSGNFNNRAGSEQKGAASVFSYSFANSNTNSAQRLFDNDLQFSDYLAYVKWDNVNRKWVFVKQGQDSASAVADPQADQRLVIIYSNPAYVSITNNNPEGYKLNIDSLLVNNRDVAAQRYGYATAKNGSTVETLLPLSADDLVLNAGESVKLMFPGVQGKNYKLNGTFVGADGSDSIEYTINGTAQTPAGATISINKNLKNDHNAEEIVIGDALPICRIGEETFPLLKEAVAYMVAQEEATGNKEYTVEMLVDYLIPENDVLEIPSGFQVTFTTAEGNAFSGYAAGRTQAILSRDFGNTGSSVILKGNEGDGSELSVTNLVFDGRAIAGTGNGGAVSTKYCDVYIDHCVFKGYQAVRGGAVFIARGGEESSLVIENTDFLNCSSKSTGNVDKAGGAAVWTTAKTLTMSNCNITNCSVVEGRGQGGAVFHNIVDNKTLGFKEFPTDSGNAYYPAGYSENTYTNMYHCIFRDCYAISAAGGSMETDAMYTVLDSCEFYDTYSGGDSGGALIIYARDQANPSAADKYSKLELKDCIFDNCQAENGNVSYGGGAVRTTTVDTIVTGCTFRNANHKRGGGLSVSNTNSQNLTLYGCTFENCNATTESGGGVYFPGVNLYIDVMPEGEAEPDVPAVTTFTSCTANSNGGGIYHSNGTASGKADISNIKFDSCTARTAQGGGLYTTTYHLSISGAETEIKNCTAATNGGGICHSRSGAGSDLILQGGSIENCNAAGGSGGGLYCTAVSVTVGDFTEGGESVITSFKGCTAQNHGGGFYHDNANDSVRIKNIRFDSCTAKTGYGGGLRTSTHKLLVSGASTLFKDCTAQIDGGGGYHSRNANGSEAFFEGGSYENCIAVTGNGGGFRTPAKNVRLKDISVTGNTALANGGGFWLESPSDGLVEGSTFTGNAVTKNDGKGGGVYVSGGTIRYKGTEISGCTAAYGGGWAQNGGTLNILAGTISGSATVNGGGVYQGDGTLNHYGGTVGGSATNGGGIYMAKGTINIGGEGTFDGTTYSGAVVGSDSIPAAAASNGGGVFATSGNLNIKPGAVIKGQAGANGGGVYNNDTATQSGGDITGTAANGGGVYLGWSYTLNAGTISGTATENGGAVYQNTTGSGNTFTINSTGIVGQTVEKEGTAEETVIGSSAVNGGGVYLKAGNLNMNDGKIVGAAANGNGGGVYVAGGTFTFKKGSIIKNTAEGNGGGVYHGGGTFNMTNGGAVIGGAVKDESGNPVLDENGKVVSNGNTANKGGGIFVANGMKPTFNDNSAKKLEISYNHAVAEGGGIAVGGANTVLTFQNMVMVRYNTMISDTIESNVYLDQNSNTVIQNGALDAAAYIGVYASDSQDNAHGQAGMPFAKYSSETNLDHYHNDRRPFLYGVKGSNNLVIWSEFVCKITDGEGNLLYRNKEGWPAVYAAVEDIAGGALKALWAGKSDGNGKTPDLYYKDAETGEYIKYQENEFQIQMLVEEYLSTQIKFDSNANGRKVTLTTASAEPDECGFKYLGDPRRSATIKRGSNTWAMIYVGGTNGEAWTLALENITLDGNNVVSGEDGAILRIENRGKAVLDQNAILKNGSTNNKYNGGAISVRTSTAQLTMNPGSQILNCQSSGKAGGGIYLEAGSVTMNGGEITGCMAANGGGVYMTNATAFHMNGGTITGNSATGNGGGIALSSNNDGSRIYFSGLVSVTENTLNGASCNVQLNRDNNSIINANGLDARSEIGIYTTSNIYTNHGEPGDPFGTWSEADDKLFCFINDRSTNLRGYQSADVSNTRIYWEYHPLLTVMKTVESDWAHDRKDVEFTFGIKLVDTTLTYAERNSIKGMTFNSDGEATVTLKAGESATAVFPEEFDKTFYEVREIPTPDQAADYTFGAEHNEADYQFAEDKPLTVEGRLGENIGTDRSTSLSEVNFINTRVTGQLAVSKAVVSSVPADYDEAFGFTLVLGDTTINKTYDLLTKDASGNETAGEISFANGVSGSLPQLKDGESFTILGLPTDLPYTVTEVLTESQNAHIRTQVQKDGSEPVYANAQSGTIGENPITETVEGITKTIYASSVAFTNNFLDIVCKIVNRSRDLLYYQDAAKNLQPAIYSHLEDAFAQINSGNLRTSGNGTVTGLLRIEMVVPEYAMEETAQLDSGKTALLSTAQTNDEDYPYNKGEDDGNGNTAKVKRGAEFTSGSMIEDKGTLTIDKIILDGSADEETPITAAADGGIINVANAVRLTINSSAVLRNSAVAGNGEGISGNGGAIYLAQGASLAHNGTILNCSANAGGGVYAANGFTTITIAGTIKDCTAENGNGGAIYASAGTSVNLNAEAELTGNHAKGSGGAVYSDANVTLRGRVGGTEAAEQANTAAGNGGGICMGSGTTFTMYAGSAISGNRAANGGGLAAPGTVRIAGGTISRNTASGLPADEGTPAIPGMGGGVYATEDASLTVSGTAELKENTSAGYGGAVYNGGSGTMSGGSITENTAQISGGAVYVAGGKTFAMSGGSISGGNKSPEGAVSTGSESILNFSGNSVVTGNTGMDGTTAMNVFLGYDSNSMIRTAGLGSGANIGVYVTDGEPEDESVADHVDDPIYCDHGKSARNFGTYTGTNINSARLTNFVNDRDPSLKGMNGGVSSGSQYYIAWTGKGLQVRVSEYVPEDPEGSGEEGGSESGGDEPAAGSGAPISGAIFELKNSGGVTVWTGSSNADGLISIPWGGVESAGGNKARFAPKSTYTLIETAAGEGAVLPSSKWTLAIGRDDSVTWSTVATSAEDNVNREHDILLPSGNDGKAYLGEIFGLNNDTKPVVTFDYMKDTGEKKNEEVAFGVKELQHTYTITENNPTWDSHVFKGWGTKESQDPENPDPEYYEYEKGDEILFYRGTETASDEKFKAKGDITLYAQWEAVVCKITDRSGTLLYIGGSPAVYGTLEEGFAVYNTVSAFTYQNGSRATARRIEMLVGSYTLEAPVTVARGKTVQLTTAPRTDQDGYAYTGAQGTVCVINRGESCNTSMITNNANLTLTNITLDGGNTAVTTDGGIVDNRQTSAVLAVSSGATLRNSVVNGNGGAIHAARGTSVTVSGGRIEGNQGNGAGIYLNQGSQLNLSGSPVFSNNTSSAALPAGAQNGGTDYMTARQDIFIAGYYGQSGDISADSLVVNGNISSASGSIWVWAEEEPHYKSTEQFAKIANGVNVTENTLSVFRNARTDADSENTLGEPLTGTAGDDARSIYWSGSKGERKIILRKTDQNFMPKSGGSFTVYRKGSSTPYEVTLPDTTKQTLSGLTADASGIFWIGFLPYGTYFINEIAAPEGVSPDNAGKWFCLIVDERGKYMSGGFHAGDAAASMAAAEASAKSMQSHP